MTIKDKLEKLDSFCEKHENCCDCVLGFGGDTCYDEENEESVNTAYELVFPSDNVNHPPHYTNGSIECIDAMISAFGKETVANFCICNAFKYVWRSHLKNGIEDISKAKWYLNKYEELVCNEKSV